MLLNSPQDVLRQSPFILPVIGLCAGICLAGQFPELSPAWLICGIALAGIGGLLLLRGTRRPALLAAILFTAFAVAGLLRFQDWHRAHFEVGYLQHLPLLAEHLEVEVLDVRAGRQLKLDVRLLRIANSTRGIPTSGIMRLHIRKADFNDFFSGQRLRLQNVRIESPPAPRNPGAFDYRRYLNRRGIVASTFIADAATIRHAGRAPGFSPEQQIFAPLRRHLQQAITAHINPRAAAFLQALLLGVRDHLDKDVVEDFQNAGVIHLLAISGLHVGFLFMLCHVLLSFLPIYYKHRNILIALILAAYAMLSGNPPVYRAALMSCIYLVGINIERRSNFINLIFASATVLLLVWPQQLFWIGFQLSFMAVLGIALTYPLLTELFSALTARLPAPLAGGLQRWLLMPLAVSLAAQIGTIPLILVYFQKISLIGLALNLIVIPYTALLVAAGFLYLAAALCSPFLAELCAGLLAFKIEALIAMVNYFAALPGAYWESGQLQNPVLFIYSALIIHWRFHRHAPTVRVCRAAIVLLVLLFLVGRQDAGRQMQAIFMDVGQGDAALLLTPDGQSILVDSGPSSRFGNAARQAIEPLLKHLDVKRIDHLFISHPHMDHIGGALHLPGKVPIGTVYFPKQPISIPLQDSLVGQLKKHKIHWRQLTAGDSIRVGNQTRIYLFGPLPSQGNFSHPGGGNLNNNSLVMQVRWRGRSILFSGDAEKAAENSLLPWGNLLNSEVLQVGHHGSESSSTASFLQQVAPEIAIISCGRQNSFGHPAAAALARLKGSGAHILRTDRQAAIWLQASPGGWRRVGW